MSSSGSVALILYYLFRALFGRYLSAAFRYLLLKLSMCFFLLPVPMLSGDIRVLIRKVIPDFIWIQKHGRNGSTTWTGLSMTLLMAIYGVGFPGYLLFYFLHGS